MTKLNQILETNKSTNAIHLSMSHSKYYDVSYNEKKKRERKGLKTFSSSPYKQTDRLSLSLLINAYVK